MTKMSVLGTHLYQCTIWYCCERLHLASVNFFEDSAHFPMWWWAIYECTCPHYSECSAVSDQKWHDPYVPPSLFFWSCPETFFLPLWKSPQMEMFCQYGRGENGRSTERHQNLQIQKLFWAVEKSVDRYIALNGQYFEGDLKFKHVRINIQFLINKFQFGGESLV